MGVLLLPLPDPEVENWSRAAEGGETIFPAKFGAKLVALPRLPCSCRITHQRAATLHHHSHHNESLERPSLTCFVLDYKFLHFASSHAPRQLCSYRINELTALRSSTGSKHLFSLPRNVLCLGASSPRLGFNIALAASSASSLNDLNMRYMCVSSCMSCDLTRQDGVQARPMFVRCPH
jgi:hypothetical protein